MKKNFDISKNVMRRVVSFEKKRSYGWIIKLGSLLAISLVSAILFIFFALQELTEQKTFELLSLFQEDWEIIKDYWKDTLDIFWIEVTQTKIAFGVLILAIVVLLLFFQKKKIKLIAKKLKVLVKYKNINNRQ